jgi:hypothetical protein
MYRSSCGLPFLVAWLFVSNPLAALPADVFAAEPFAIEVVDEQTGRGVPLVELTTTGGIAYVTDSAGLVAFDEPGLLGQRVHFAVKSHGYEFRKDGFGFAGVALDTQPGGSAQLKIKRLNIAERLYRVTGAGIYRDSVLVGREPPLKQPLLNAQVVGSDSVVSGVYQGRLRWFWGDTNQVKYPLGLYSVPGATSKLPEDGGLDPARGVDLEYFTGESGFARAVAQMPGDGPTWIGGLAVLPDASGRERMLSGYMKIKAPMEVYRRGIAVWNDDTNVFDRVSDFEPKAPLYPDGHTFLHQSETRGACAYFASPFPLVRARATAEAYQDLAKYEAFTCLKEGSTQEQPVIDRDDEGAVNYQWRKNTPTVGPGEQAKLVKSGLLKPHEGLLQLRDIATGKPVNAHAGSVNWNAYRKRFVLIATELYGSSLLGEVWYAEADSPVGPWVYATKIVTHDKYSFYNPKQHPIFDQEGGRLIYFEGTYTHSFSGNEHKTPRYDYNQIMYRLDLADERLVLPVAVYDRGHGSDMHGRADQFDWRFAECAERAKFRAVPFFVLDRAKNGTIPIYRTGEGDHMLLSLEQQRDSKPLFWGLPTDQDAVGTVPLFEYSANSGARRYSIDRALSMKGFKRVDKPVCQVWSSPYQ